MKRVYLVPAPDMDPRANDSIVVDGVEIIQLRLPKLSIEMSLLDLVQSLQSQIRDEKPTLLGFCYGSVLAIEVGKRSSAEKIIVVSGIKNFSELGTLRKALLYLFLFTPNKMLVAIGVSSVFVLNSLLKLKLKIPRLWLKSSQNKFIVKHLANFNSQGVESKIVRIHGDQDFIVPASRLKIDYVIKSGGHFMFMDHHKQVLEAISVAIVRRF